MESAIKTFVTTFLSSARGKENLEGNAFQKLVSKQLSNIMGVKNYLFNMIIIITIIILPYYTFTSVYPRIQTAPLPSRRCRGAWMKTTMERSASRNT